MSAPPGKSAPHDTMQQMQLWIFWAIAAGIDNLRLHPHAETKNEATNEPLQPAVQNNMSWC
jgi:hypothetical protein